MTERLRGGETSTPRDGGEATREPSKQSVDETVEDCPECSGRLVTEEDTDEVVCSKCGLVVDERSIDRGPEWRAFDAQEREEKSRVGAPTTELLHDKGLSTTIGWQDRDANGNALDSRKRQRMARLRTWDERFRTRDSRERNLKQALGEINRMASALGLPEHVRETAGATYRQALENDLLPGRSIEGVATAALYAASRLQGVARSVDEVAAVSRVDALEIKRTYRYVIRELDLAVPPTNPAEYIGRFASDLNVTEETEREARNLVNEAVEAGVHSGKHPVGIAASALYAAGKLTDADVTQTEISEVANVSEVTIRNRYREVLAVRE